jgi:hypothetical protein
MTKIRKYQIPDFLVQKGISQVGYGNLLKGKASSHVTRDRKRGNLTATREAYKVAIHNAVLRSGGKDAYTGKQPAWSLISHYSNAESKAAGRNYKAKSAYLPTADHVGDGLGAADFEICAWRTNDAKNDLSHSDFVALCRLVVAHADRGGGGSQSPDRSRQADDV